MVSDRRLPSNWQIRAGLRAASAISRDGAAIQDVERSLPRLPTDGLYRHDDLSRGLDVLVQAGLLRCENDRLIPTMELVELHGMDEPVAVEAAISCYLTRHPPLWIHTAVGAGAVRHELIPDTEHDILSGLINDPDRREAFLLAVASKVNAEEDAALGGRGEDFVAEQCRQHLKEAQRPQLADRVRRVSLVTDALGYDVTSPTKVSGIVRLEVKTTRTTGPGFEFILSRHEAEVASRDPRWFLVACRESDDEIMTLIGWCASAQVQPLLPTDPITSGRGRGRWASVHVTLPSDHLKQGLPLD